MDKTCWLCGTPAVTTCHQCGQPVCEEHLKPIPAPYVDIFGPDGCERCVAWSLEAIERMEKRPKAVVDPPLEERTCAFDGRVFDHALPRCTVCNRPFCPDHGVRYRRKLYIGSPEGYASAFYWEYENRCREHPLDAREEGEWERVEATGDG